MKTPKPWFRAHTQTWYVCLNGVQHNLGKDKKEADKKFHRLMADEGLARPVKDLPLGGLVEQFLVDSAKSCTVETVQWYRVFLADFAERYPKLKPADIAPRHVRAWLTGDHPRPWKQTTHRSAITILKRLLNWAVANKLLAENPVKDFERPAATVRKRVLTPEERAKILAWYPEGDVFHDFLVALMESGVRPGEAMKVTADDVDFDLGVSTVSDPNTAELVSSQLLATLTIFGAPESRQHRKRRPETVGRL